MSPQREATDNAKDEWTSPHAFVELMALERLETTYVTSQDSTEPEKIERFRSLAAPFPPGEGTRSFGGHVYAQSAYAASKTTEWGLVIHVSSFQPFKP
jgi:acyl-CoA thioesterase